MVGEGCREANNGGQLGKEPSSRFRGGVPYRKLTVAVQDFRRPQDWHSTTSLRPLLSIVDFGKRQSTVSSRAAELVHNLFHNWSNQTGEGLLGPGVQLPPCGFGPEYSSLLTVQLS